MFGPRPPWTAEQVARLNEYQACDWVHPFTCPNRDTHVSDVTIVVGESVESTVASVDGSLIARESGWYCPDCGYEQLWAHDFMFNGAPPKPRF